MTGFGNYSPQEEMLMQTHPFKTIIAELAHLAMQIEEINRKPFGPGIDLHAPVSEDGESGDGEEVRLFAFPGQVLVS